jgi:hypothetical protein
MGTVLACQPRQETQKVETETTTKTSPSGETIESETTAAGRVPGGGEIDTKHQEYVGTVDKYALGKSIEIKSVDGETHSFDLDDNDTVVKVEPGIKMGAKVKVEVHQEKDRPETITITPAS